VEKPSRGEAFEAFVREHEDRVYRTARAVVGNDDDARDVAQEVFLKAWRALDSYRGDSNVRPWVYRITLNAGRDHLRKARRRPASSAVSPEDLPLPDTQAGPGELAERAEISRAIRQAMDALPARHRDAVILREIEGLSYREMSRALGCSVGTAQSRLFRGREALRALLHSHLTKGGRV
jgi:RNA polymerase sigma-70 factor (ECF subfamily)